MRQAILTSAFVLTTSLCFGQIYLKPVDFNQKKRVQIEYYDNVFPLLYEGYSEKPIARYTSMPSFSNEYSFSVETIGGKNYVVSNILSENYWYAKNRKEVKLVSNKTELAKDLYLKLIDLFKLIEIEQTKKPEVDINGSQTFKFEGFDGVNFYFATTDTNGQVKIGKTWSPGENSFFGRLVKICDNIYSLGNGKNISQAETLKDIDKLLNELNQ